MHPMKREAEDAINAKMRRMTRDYGSTSGPANNKLAPMERDKAEGPEESIGFGADSGAPRGRGDRAGRKPVTANPIPTYAKGGAAIGRASGGRAKKKGATNVNVIVAPQGGGAPPMPPAPPIVAGPPPGAAPMPPKPPMGAGPMGMPPGAADLPMAPGAPGGLPPGIVPPRAKGGRVAKKRDDGGSVDRKQDAPEQAGPRRQIFPTGSIGNKLFDAADKQKLPPEGTGSTLPYDRFKRGRASGGRISGEDDDAVTERTRKNEGLVHERASGGGMPRMTAGAATGEGRLQKIGKHGKNAGRPQAV